jgi:hypothetical protein
MSMLIKSISNVWDKIGNIITPKTAGDSLEVTGAGDFTIYDASGVPVAVFSVDGTTGDTELDGTLTVDGTDIGGAISDLQDGPFSYTKIEDDFAGASFDDPKWGITTTGTSSFDLLDEVGGVLQLITGASNTNSILMDTSSLRNFNSTKLPTFISRVMLGMTDTMTVQIGLWGSATAMIVFILSGTNWGLFCKNGASEGTIDLGVAASTVTYQTLKVVMTAVNACTVYIDGISCGSVSGATVPNSQFKPYVFLKTNENVSKNMRLDAIQIKQVK